MKEALGKMKNSKEKNMCWQDGRLFDDKEDWVVDSCTKCSCQVKTPTRRLSSYLQQRSETVSHRQLTGVQDSVSPNHLPPCGLCQPAVRGRRVLPGVFT